MLSPDYGVPVHSLYWGITGQNIVVDGGMTRKMVYKE
jgi:hypothetical protein